MTTKIHFTYSRRLDNRINDLVTKPNPITFEIGQELKKKLIDSGKNEDEVLNELFSLYFKTNQEIQEYIASYTKVTTPIMEEEVKKALNMENITDFDIDQMGYIRIRLQDGRIRLIENRTKDTSEEIFKGVQEIIKANSKDGVQNSEEIFNSLMKRYVEIPLENSKFIDTTKLSEEQVRIKSIIDSQFPNQTIIASPERNIFIIQDDEEKVVRVVNNNGIYEIENIEERTYSTVLEDAIKKDGITDEDNYMVEQPVENDYLNEVETLQTEITELIAEGKTKEEIFESLATSKNITDLNEQRKLFEIIEEQMGLEQESLQKDKRKDFFLPNSYFQNAS